jgi:hypothetical protein
VQVLGVGKQWFRFLALPGHVGQGGTIQFSTFAADGKVFIRFEAAVARGSGERALPPLTELAGRATWSKMVAAMKKEYLEAHEW